jgi:hypothetical protein
MIAKKADPEWGVPYEVRLRGLNGKERSFRTRKETECYERAQQTAVDQGLRVDPRSGRVTLSSWSTEWAAQGGPSAPDDPACSHR